MQALGGASDGQAALVSLFSVASAAGRLAAGHLPERALHAWRTPRCACAWLLCLRVFERVTCVLHVWDMPLFPGACVLEALTGFGCEPACFCRCMYLLSRWGRICTYLKQ